MAIGAKTGGRRKGVPNKDKAVAQAAKAQDRLTPLEYLLSVMEDISEERRIRIDAAKAAAPYVHAKLASIEVGNKAGEVFKVGLLSEDGGLL